LVEYSFTGRIYAVNPQAHAVAGVASYPTLTAVPEVVDLAVIAVPAAAVLDVMADAGAASVRATVVVSAGFSELGPGGRATQVELVRRELWQHRPPQRGAGGSLHTRSRGRARARPFGDGGTADGAGGPASSRLRGHPSASSTCVDRPLRVRSG